MEDLALVWLRRDLRTYDHKPLYFASKHKSYLPFFIFDPNILNRFKNPSDRRLTFIASSILEMQKTMQILVIYGDPKDILPKLVNLMNPVKIYAGSDFEPENIERDKKIALLTGKLQLLDDHIIKNPKNICKEDGTAFKVYTPYSKVWKKSITPEDIEACKVDTNKALKDIQLIKDKLIEQNIKVVDTTSLKQMLSDIGYNVFEESFWLPQNARKILQDWCNNKIQKYKDTRDFMDRHGTSMISPYIRFGLVSIRECYNYASQYPGTGADTWINELIWREFYIAILYHFPESANMELQQQYRNLEWSNNKVHLEAWIEGKTGYPIIDAAMRQLKQLGWMHNRARMITASFFTKHLFLDWRVGEEYFAQYLMDYEMASNVGGWQWSSSTGTDAQPYFRIFNPFLQSKKFDPEGIYIKKYVDELKNYKGNIHEPHLDGLYNKYYPLIVEHDMARKNAISKFKAIV